jgi:acetyl esterase/lipase
MRCAKSVFIVLTTVATWCSAATPEKVDFPVSVERGGDSYPSLKVEFPQGVTGYPYVVYSRREGFRPLMLDLYLPRGDAGKAHPHPALVYIHGGSWLTGSPRTFPHVLAAIAARGFVVAAIQYRFDGEATFPAQIADVKEAVRYLRVNAEKYSIDSDHIGVWGESAGGQLAALESVSCGVSALEPKPKPVTEQGDEQADLSDVSDCVQASVSWYGIYNFVTIPIPPGKSGPQPYLGCPAFTCDQAALESASPAYYVDSHDPPMLLIHGIDDPVVTVSQAREFNQQLHQAGVSVELLLIPGVKHGFVGATSDITRAARNQALNATLSFFERTLAKH